jgi:membrane protein DedA with SNARE-associated domain
VGSVSRHLSPAGPGLVGGASAGLCATIKVSLIFLEIHIHLIRHGVPAPNIDYVALALGAFASWAGLPGPGEPLLIAAAIVASKHKLDISPVLAWAFVGASVGGIAGWLAGRVAGRSVMTAPGPLRRLRLKAVARGEEVFERWTVTAILLTPAWVAGIHRVGAGVYLITNELSAVVWSVGIGLGAYYAGPPVLDVMADIGWLSLIGLVLLVAAAVVLELNRRRRRKAEPA